MKTTTALFMLCLGSTLGTGALRAQDNPTPAAPGAAAAGQPAKDYDAMARALLEASAEPAPPRPGRDGGGGSLRFNFRGAPLETVLNYLSEAAGYVIVLETPVRGGTVDMWSAQPVSRQEAVQLLNLALNKNGYTATVKGRNLIISSKEEARKKNIPIRTGNDPREIPDNAEMVMQIIPLERIDANQAAADLATLLPSSATITANQDSNSLIVTDTQTNIRHIVELISALDGSAGSVSAMKVFRLKNADPTEMAQLISNLYGQPASGTAGRGGFPGGFPGFGAFGGPGGAATAAIAAAAAARGGGTGGSSGRGGSSSRGSSSRSSTAGSRGTPVVAVADPRTYSVIVTASKEALVDIGEMITQLDSNAARKQKVFVYTMENGDVKQVESILRNLFQNSNTRSTNSQQVDPLSTRASSNSQASGSNITLGTNGARR